MHVAGIPLDHVWPTLLPTSRPSLADAGEIAHLMGSGYAGTPAALPSPINSTQNSSTPFLKEGALYASNARPSEGSSVSAE